MRFNLVRTRSNFSKNCGENEGHAYSAIGHFDLKYRTSIEWFGTSNFCMIKTENVISSLTKVLGVIILYIY